MVKLTEELKKRGWIKTNLGHAASIIGGFAFKGEHFSEIKSNFSMPVVKITDIKPPYVNIDKAKFIDLSKYSKEKLKKFLVLKGDFLVAMTGATIGKVGLVISDTPAYLNQRVAKIDEIDNISYKKFIYQIISSKEFTRFIQDFSAGSSAQQNISATDISKFPILLPPLSDQKKIANILTQLDNKIELLQEQNNILEETAQTIFKEWFGKYDFSKNESLPDGWKVGKLDTEFDVTIGRTPPRAESKWFSNIPIGKKWISIKDIGNSGAYIFNTTEYLTEEAIKKFNIPVIPKNTTILSFKMTVGKLTITTEDMLSNEAIAHLILKKDSALSTEYIYCYLKKLDFNSLGSTSSIVTAINSTMIKNLDILIPDRSILSKFNLIIKHIFNKILSNSKQVQVLQQNKDFLLTQLISGNIDLSKSK